MPPEPPQASAARSTSLGYAMNTVAALWRRDLWRFARQPSRLIGALGQPILFWGIIGSGFAATFVLPGSHVPYPQFFFAGVVTMVALFASIFASVSIIEDRSQGFLLAVMSAPAPRWSMMLGKSLGAATVAAVQIGLFLLLAPLAGFAWTAIAWLPLTGALFCICMGLSALGFAVAWWLDNVQAYHAVQMTLLVPLWVLSGAMFPVPASPALQWVAACNPLSYGVSAVRHALHGGVAPAASVQFSPGDSQLALVVFAIASLTIAARACAAKSQRAPAC